MESLVQAVRSGKDTWFWCLVMPLLVTGLYPVEWDQVFIKEGMDSVSEVTADTSEHVSQTRKYPV
jgi:hypothetical protein